MLCHKPTYDVHHVFHFNAFHHKIRDNSKDNSTKTIPLSKPLSKLDGCFFCQAELTDELKHIPTSDGSMCYKNRMPAITVINVLSHDSDTSCAGALTVEKSSVLTLPVASFTSSLFAAQQMQTMQNHPNNSLNNPTSLNGKNGRKNGIYSYKILYHPLTV